MTSNKGHLAAAVAIALATAAAMPAQAEDGWIIRAGVAMVDPKSDNLALAPTTQVQVDERAGFTLDVTKMLTPNWGIELLAAYPFEHDIDLETPTGRSALGGVTHLPPTLSLQYHFNPEGCFRPYAGVGLNYTLFWDEEPSALKLDDSFGIAAGGGVDVTLGEKLLLNLAVKWVDIDADATLGGASIGTVEIDPIVYSLSLGWRFGGAN